MEYYVLSNLSHDGKDFTRGDRIALTEQAATPLIEAGVIQTDPVEAKAPPAAPAQEAKAADEATVGGSARKTGEPSLDGSQERTGADTTIDITPKVDEKPVDAGTPKPGFLGRILGDNKTKPADTTPPAPPAEDPSANL